MRILYVEDVPPNLVLVERIASMGDHEVIHYTTAEEALANFDADQPDIVLVDIYLEGPMDGIMMVRQLREMGYTKPIFVLTAYATIDVREASLEAGANNFFTKPLQVRQFWRLIQQNDPSSSMSV